MRELDDGDWFRIKWLGVDFLLILDKLRLSKTLHSLLHDATHSPNSLTRFMSRDTSPLNRPKVSTYSSSSSSCMVKSSSSAASL